MQNTLDNRCVVSYISRKKLYMNKLMTMALVGLLAFTGCKKEITNINQEHYSLNDFTDTRAAEAGVVYKNEIGPNNLKAIVRKVANTDNQYRLILKVDSVYAEAGKNAEGVPQFKMVALEMFEQTAIVTSGLSMKDPLNPDKESVFFADGEMQFTRIQENGFYVYACAPFAGPSGTTDEVMNSFDYELVNLQYTIKHGKGLRDDYPDSGTVFSEFTTGNHLCFILPGGKAIEQNPEVEKVNKQGKWLHASGKEFAKTIVITIANDPAQEIEKLVFKPGLVKVATGDPNNPVKYIELPSVDLEKTHFNQNNGVARFSSDRWKDTYGDGKSPGEWSGSGEIYGITPKGTLYNVNKTVKLLTL